MLRKKHFILGFFMTTLLSLGSSAWSDDLPCTVSCGVQCGHRLFVQHKMHKRYHSAGQAAHWRACMKGCMRRCPEQMKTCGLGDAYRAQYPATQDELGQQIPNYQDVPLEDQGAAGGPVDDDDDPYASSGSESESEDEDYGPQPPVGKRYIRHVHAF